MSKKLVILGAGGYANTVKDVSEQLGYDVIAMLTIDLPTARLILLLNILLTIQNLFLPLEITSFACLGAIK